MPRDVLAAALLGQINPRALIAPPPRTLVPITQFLTFFCVFRGRLLPISTLSTNWPRSLPDPSLTVHPAYHHAEGKGDAQDQGPCRREAQEGYVGAI